MKQKEIFRQALEDLETLKKYGPPYSVITQAGAIVLFKRCLERGCMAIRETLEAKGYHDIRMDSVRPILKRAYAFELIEDEKDWLQMLDDYQQEYDFIEDSALPVLSRIQEIYIPLLEKLKYELDNYGEI
jgi:nucleotidyltransferase substrate binding protein (TIGR01987 family)